MSAILGIYHRDGQRVDLANLEKMVDILAHRGPDGSGIWNDDCVGLGHRMLWTTPESMMEKLPLVHHTSNLVITADARIDNREELFAALGLMGQAIEKITDSEFILYAYEKWGDRCPEYLLGDFAFAIWDGHKQVLFCARDHFGVKPLYYYCSDDNLIFASEIKALLCLPNTPHQLNEVRVAEYLECLDGNPALTFYQDILRLPPAHSMIVSKTGIKLQLYWHLDATPELRLSSNEEYANKFREIFTEAVRCRLRSAFALGSMLSGGLDSSSITCVARKLLVAKGESCLPTFSARFNKVTQSDESFFQDAVIAEGNLKPHYLYGDERGPLSDWERVLWHQDQVLDAGNLYLNWGLYECAKKQNVRVILDGFDGDTTVSHGNEYLRELARTRKWLNLAIETRAYGQRFNVPWKKVLWTWIWRSGIKPTFFPVLKPLHKIYQTWRAPQVLANKPLWNTPFNPDFAQSINLAELCKVNAQEPPETERQNHYRLLTRNVMPQTLELLDKAAGAFSIELRFPFFDKRLIEFCLALPPEQKLNQGWGRVVMRRAMNNILPKEVQWRAKKSNLHPSFEYGLLTFEQQHIEEAILKYPEIIAKYVDIATLRQTHQRLLAREATQEEVNLLWRTVSLSLWLRRTGIATQSLPITPKEVYLQTIN